MLDTSVILFLSEVHYVQFTCALFHLQFMLKRFLSLLLCSRCSCGGVGLISSTAQGAQWFSRITCHLGLCVIVTCSSNHPPPLFPTQERMSKFRGMREMGIDFEAIRVFKNITII